MKTFVTGGNGFIGSVVVRQLAGLGHELKLLLRPTSATERIAGLRYERVVGDVRDGASLSAGMVGCDGVIHLASLSSWDDINSPKMREIVVDGTRNVLQAAAAAGNIKTVFVSSTSAIAGSSHPRVFAEDADIKLDDPGLVYVQSKREAEQLCQEAYKRGLPVTIVNPGEVYGPNDTGLITAKNLIDFAKSWPVIVCSGGTLVAHVDDVADGIIAALIKGRPGQRYILGSDNLSIRDLARLCGELLGKPKPTLTLPNPFIRTLAKIGTALRLPLPFHPAVIPYATRYWFMDSRKAKEELGVEFRSARQVLAPTLAWLKEAGHVT